MGIVYCATNKENNLVYIGQSVKSLKDRLRTHKADAFQKKVVSPFYNAIRKYGWDTFTWKVLDTGAFFRDIGYNMNTGGDNRVYNEEHCKHMSEIKKETPAWNKGKKLSEEHKKNLSISHTGYKMTPKHIENSRRGHLGIPCSNEKKEKIRKALIGHEGAGKKSVICIETQKQFSSLKEVERVMNIRSSSIGMCCNGKLKTSGGYHWQYIRKVG
jgi:group I intron endonuclease